MQLENLSKQLAFIREIDKVKYVWRTTRLFNSDRRENDAEHSWHLAVMALTLAEHANTPVDLFKVVKMLLIHDLVEIDTGDVWLFDSVVNHTNTEAERLAARRIFGLLPHNQAEGYLTIWEEFEAGVTPEARFARAIDRLEPILQNISNQGGTWAEFNIPYEKVVQKTTVIGLGSRQLGELVEALIAELFQQPALKKETLEEN